MTTDRPYRQRLTVNQAVEKVVAGAGTQFDSEVVRGIEDLREFGALDRYGSEALAEAA
jgi:HD-GYP domain-containing protein (c-di-GMP phosphodiesterase class II)